MKKYLNNNEEPNLPRRGVIVTAIIILAACISARVVLFIRKRT